MAEIIKFTAGVSEVVALKFAEGKNCAGKFGPQVQFTTTDERIFWLDPEPASDVEREIARLGIATGAPFKLTKRKTTHGGHAWTVDPIQQARDTGGHNVPARQLDYAYDQRSTPAPIAAPAPVNSTTARLCAALCSAIDAAAEATEYAERHGMPLEWQTEDIRALAITAFIEASKGGR